MIRTQVYLPELLYQNINLLARREKKPTAQVLRELLHVGLKAKRRQSNAGRDLLGIAKIKAHGPKDLSTKIDRYLYKE